MALTPATFHLAFPTHDLALCRDFYEKLGAIPGRENSQALIFNLGGHQLVAHLVKDLPSEQAGIYPRHFGLIFDRLKDWEACLEGARSHQLRFYREPQLRFEKTPLEHRSFFLADPSHNLLEFKFYSFPEAIFGPGDRAPIGEKSP